MTTAIEPTTTPEPSAAVPGRRVLRPWMAGAAAVVVCVAVRLAYLLSDRDRFNGDEAATGVMVHQILRGHQFTFFAGQSYGGTLEQYLSAFIYFVFRLPQNRFTLRLPQLCLIALACALVYAYARRTLPSRTHAVLAALLFAVGPWYNVQDVMAMGFYALSQTLAIAGVYAAVRLADDSARLRWAFAFGVIGGLAYWNALIAAYALVPALLWLSPILIRRIRLLGPMAGGAIIGAAPVLHWMWQTHSLLPLPHKNVAISVSQRLSNLSGPVLREFTGVGITDGDPQPGLGAGFVVVVLALLGAGYLALLWHRRRGLLALCRLRVSDRSPLDIALLAPPITVLLYLTSSSGVFIVDPKYLLSDYPLYAVLLAAMVRFVRPRAVLASAVVLVTATGLVTLRYFAHPTWQITANRWGGQSTLPHSRTRDAQLEKAIDYLVAHRERGAYSTYWTAMPLKYLAGDRLTVGTLYLGRERFPEVDPVLRATPNITYVLDTTNHDDLSVLARLSRRTSFQIHYIGPRIEVIDHLGPSGRPEKIGLISRKPPAH